MGTANDVGHLRRKQATQNEQAPELQDNMCQLCAALMQVTQGEANDVACNSLDIGLAARKRLAGSSGLGVPAWSAGCRAAMRSSFPQVRQVEGRSRD